MPDMIHLLLIRTRCIGVKQCSLDAAIFPELSKTYSADMYANSWPLNDNGTIYSSRKRLWNRQMTAATSGWCHLNS
jgi:hypothetical protein